MKALTDKEISAILKDMLILVDTREQKNQHIIDYLDSKGIPHKLEKLETADYTFILPNYADLGFDRQILIEKKNSLDEISGNFTKDRERFTREFERVTTEKIHLVIENATWKKLLNGTYRSQLNPRAFMASMMSWNIRYNCPVWFVGKEESPVIIYNLMYYELFEKLKQKKLDK